MNADSPNPLNLELFWTHFLERMVLVKKLLAVLLCLSFVSFLSIGIVGCGETKKDKDKAAAEKEKEKEKK